MAIPNPITESICVGQTIEIDIADSIDDYADEPITVTAQNPSPPPDFSPGAENLEVVDELGVGIDPTGTVINGTIIFVSWIGEGFGEVTFWYIVGSMEDVIEITITANCFLTGPNCCSSETRIWQTLIGETR